MQSSHTLHSVFEECRKRSVSWFNTLARLTNSIHILSVEVLEAQLYL